MSSLHIDINLKSGQSFDSSRNHLKLGENRTFSVTIKEYEDASSNLGSLSGAELQKKEKELTEKYKKVKWVNLLVQRRLSSDDLSSYAQKKESTLPRKAKFPEFLVGGGMIWLEPFFETEIPTGKIPHGCYISALGKPRIIETYWTDYQYNEITEDVAFGSQVLLHIFTKDLYGQEVAIQLIDRDIFDPNDYLFRYRREVNAEQLHAKEKGRKGVGGKLIIGDGSIRHAQKIVLSVYVDLAWKENAGSNLKIFPAIKSESEKQWFKGFTRKYLSVKKNGRLFADPNVAGNTAVMVGNVETNIRAFSPCRFTQIDLKYKKTEPVILFSEEDQVNAGNRIIDLGVIGGNLKNDKEKLTINIQNVDTEQCNNEPELHTNVVIETKELDEADIEFEYNEGATTTLVFIPKYPYEHIKGSKTDFIPFFLEYFPVFNESPALLKLPVNSCAYQKQLDLRIYPDVAFSYHLFIGDPKARFDDSIYYRDEKVKLVKGLDKELDWRQEGYDSTEEFRKHLPGSFLDNIIMTIIYDYLRARANSFSFGMHAYRSYKGGKPVIVDYTAEYPFVAKIVIGAYLVLTVLIDAFLIYLTRGENLPIILRAAKVAKRDGDLVAGQIEGGDRDNINLLWPQISITRGIGYETQDDGRIALVLEEKIKAAPLFGVQYIVEETLGSFAARLMGITAAFDMAEKAVSLVGKLRRAKKVGEWAKEKAGGSPKKASSSDNPINYTGPKDFQEALNYTENKIHLKLDAFAEKYGQKAKLTLRIDGFYDAHYHFKAHLLTNSTMLSLDIFTPDGAGTNYIDETSVVFGKNKGIDVEAAFEASSTIKIELSKMYQYVPNFLKNYVAQPEDITVDSSADIKIIGSINFERKFIYTLNTEPMYQDTTIFTGLVGKIKIAIKVEKGDKTVLDKSYESNKGEPKEEFFTLVPPFVIPGKLTPIYDKPLKKYFK